MLKYLKRGPGFYGYLWRLTGPIALQNLITFSLGLIDTLMVSWLGNTQMAAVTTANVPQYMRHRLRAAANWRSARNRSMRQSTAVG